MFTKKKKSFSLEGIDKGHYNITYKNIACLKCPFDYVIYQMIIQEVQPDLIIEIGTNMGGSTLYLADLLELQGKGEVHSIDIVDECSEIVKNHSRIKLFFEGWQEYNLDYASSFRNILVIEDSSHQYKNTIDAINKFSSLVTLDSYLIVEDGIINDLGRSEEFNGGPLKAIEEFLIGNPSFLLASKWLDFFGDSATFNTKGYLKRIK
jgi:cephalosporin hydroxylase